MEGEKGWNEGVREGERERGRKGKGREEMDVLPWGPIHWRWVGSH